MRSKATVLVFSGFWVVSLLLLPRLISAQLKITEIHPNPISTGDASEWVELQNQGDLVLDLGEWELDGTPLPEGVSLQPQEVIVFVKNAQAFISEFGGYSNFYQSGISLRNSGDKVELTGPESFSSTRVPFYRVRGELGDK